MNLGKLFFGAIAAGIICLMHSTIATAQTPEFPYPNTNYDEPYRAQFHFSPQGGWMNDVNGIWFYKGEYHMTFQHYPHGLAWAQMHWGHATSTDMMHWVQKPIALEPDVNVPGDCYSGSVVVDSANISGFKTGSEAVFVAIYTATKRGTCLAYSNDKGATWQAYSGNPVAIGTTNESTRDPHVFWHAPTSKWVCAEWENATVFYTSPDLKNWTKASTYNFGFECPDIFELAVDGGATKKWVILDAGANYHIGSFNGTTFTPDAGGPWKMDVGPDFYASQTFFRKNSPDNRVIQMAWMRGNLGTSPWTHEASFPCEIKLSTFTEGVRVTRNPMPRFAVCMSRRSTGTASSSPRAATFSPRLNRNVLM
jgi:fructan beta-fructosidase